MHRFYAHRVIETAGVAENLSPMGDIPKNKAQAHELPQLLANQQHTASAANVRTANPMHPVP
jgi:hypothetical protein